MSGMSRWETAQYFAWLKPACILAQTYIPAVVRAVLDRRPMTPDDFHHLRVRVLIERTARQVQSHFVRLR